MTFFMRDGDAREALQASQLPRLQFCDEVDSCRSTGCRVAVTKVLAGLGAFVLPSSQASDDDVEQSDIASPSARNAPLDDPAALLRRNRKAWRFARSGPDDTTSRRSLSVDALPLLAISSERSSDRRGTYNPCSPPQMPETQLPQSL